MKSSISRTFHCDPRQSPRSPVSLDHFPICLLLSLRGPFTTGICYLTTCLPNFTFSLIKWPITPLYPALNCPHRVNNWHLNDRLVKIQNLRDPVSLPKTWLILPSPDRHELPKISRRIKDGNSIRSTALSNLTDINLHEFSNFLCYLSILSHTSFYATNIKFLFTSSWFVNRT